ncbi:hypothetical protein GYMLUDRAFT_43496 [Collybiopsis luxurians FD-317 M1]|uniref:Uncharacterized protein n=1 Tax=Collybiopsis luxurians FD-317 M1 TaxID=944289 RepID=A0A0D0BB26_9AGAR|nr:hypothetical protein GYMLUDRAFT_43496 [Collybiopsis luxurians FD-317 M1]
MASYPRSSPGLPPPPEIITYRLGDKLVYVTPPLDYEEAIDLAIQEFPSLKAYTEKGESRDRIAFYTVTTMSQGTRHSVCISKSAWKPCVSRMLRGDVVNIVVLPPSNTNSSTTTNEAELPPPQYLEVPDLSGQPASHRKSRSIPPSSHSGASGRHKSPSGSTRSSGSSKRRSWFNRS